MAREQYLIGVDPEDLKPEKKPETPMTFGQKLQMLWYRYHVAIIFAAIVLVLAVVVGLLIGSREKVDYSIAVVTKSTLSEVAVEEIAANLEAYGEDLDGDGIVNVRVIPLSMNDSGDYVELSTLFSSGSTLFFAMEPTYYKAQIEELETGDTHYFTELNVEGPGVSENGRYWDWKDTLMQKGAFSVVPQSLYFGVRLPVGTAAGSANEKDSAACTALLQRMIAAAEYAES